MKSHPGLREQVIFVTSLAKHTHDRIFARCRQRPPPGAPIPTADLEDAHYAKPLRTLSLDFDWFNNRGNTLLLQECKLVLQKVIRDVGGSPAGPLFQPTFAGLMVLHSLELFHHKLFYKLFSKEL